MCRKAAINPTTDKMAGVRHYINAVADLLAVHVARAFSPYAHLSLRLESLAEGQECLACLLATLLTAASLPAAALALWPCPPSQDIKAMANHVVMLGASLDRAAADIGRPGFEASPFAIGCGK